MALKLWDAEGALVIPTVNGGSYLESDKVSHSLILLLSTLKT